jgi:hypothetical protein
MHHTRLDDRAGPDGLHRLGQALEPAADQHEHVVQAAVLQPGEDVQPALRALDTVPSPDAEDVAGPLGGDGHDTMDRPVRDLPIPNLHADGIHEQDRIDAVQRPVPPFGHALHHLAVIVEVVCLDTSAHTPRPDDPRSRRA